MKQNILKNGIVTTISMMILTFIIYFWTQSAMPVYLVGILIGLISTIPVVDFLSKYHEKINKWYFAFAAIEALLVFVSIYLIYITYSLNPSLWTIAIVLFFIVIGFINKKSLMIKLKSMNILEIVAAILSEITYILPNIKNNHIISAVLGLILIIININIRKHNNK